MADKRIKIGQSSLFGPAGSVTTDKRIKIAQSNVHGSLDKRIIIAQSTLVAPPPDKRIRIAQSQLVGPASSTRPTYIGTTSGWVAVDVYLPIGGVWQKIT